MIKTLHPKTVNADVNLFEQLADREILFPIYNMESSAKVKQESYALKKLVNTPSSGHQLISVNYNITKPDIGYHLHPEVFMIFSNKQETYKPLYLFTAMHNNTIIEEKIEKGTLCDDDFLRIILDYNNPKLSCFVMNSNIPHCELTEPDEHEIADKVPPLFYVSEPLDMQTISIATHAYNFKWE